MNKSLHKRDTKGKVSTSASEADSTMTLYVAPKPRATVSLPVTYWQPKETLPFGRPIALLFKKAVAKGDGGYFQTFVHTDIVNGEECGHWLVFANRKTVGVQFRHIVAWADIPTI